MERRLGNTRICAKSSTQAQTYDALTGRRPGPTLQEQLDATKEYALHLMLRIPFSVELLDMAPAALTIASARGSLNLPMQSRASHLCNWKHNASALVCSLQCGHPADVGAAITGASDEQEAVLAYGRMEARPMEALRTPACDLCAQVVFPSSGESERAVLAPVQGFRKIKVRQ